MSGVAPVRGAHEETLALDYLRAQGCELVARNFRCKAGELDLVMCRASTLLIVEVRKRSHAGFASAAESVDARKQARIVRAAQQFLVEHPQYSRHDVRFDVVALDGAGHLDWIEAAFDA